jgi:hypothetical protein
MRRIVKLSVTGAIGADSIGATYRTDALLRRLRCPSVPHIFGCQPLETLKDERSTVDAQTFYGF